MRLPLMSLIIATYYILLVLIFIFLVIVRLIFVSILSFGFRFLRSLHKRKRTIALKKI